MTRRSYSQFCGLARALDLVGERWALLVVRGLILGPKRFTDLQSDLPGIGTNVLSTRLKELERDGIVRRRTLPPPAASSVYELTHYGRELEPALLALGRWGVRSLGSREPGQSLRSGWIGVALRAFARPEACQDVPAEVELRLEEGTFTARLGNGAVTVLDAPAEAPDLVLETPNEPFLALATRSVTAAELAAVGALRLEGDERVLERFLDAFAFPPPHETEREE